MIYQLNLHSYEKTATHPHADGKGIFLPASGCYVTNLHGVASNGYFWTGHNVTSN